MMSPIIGVNALQSKNLNVEQSKTNNDTKNDDTMTCEDLDKPETCSFPPKSGSDEPISLIIVCFNMACKHNNSSDLENINPVRNGTIFIGMSLNNTNHLTQNIDQIKPVLYSY